MTARIMKNLYAKLVPIGFGFETCQVQMINNYHGRGEYLVSHGILRDCEGNGFTNERLKSVLALAKKKDTYLIINPEAKTIAKKEHLKFKTIALKENEMVVNFIQSGMLDMFRMTYAKTERALRQTFLHYQEDKPLLELEASLERVDTHLWEFRSHAYQVDTLAEKSELLRMVLKIDGAPLTRNQELSAYLDDYDSQRIAKTMCYVGVCLRIIC